MRDWEESEGRPARGDGWAIVRVTSQVIANVMDEIRFAFGSFPLVPHPANDTWVTIPTGQPDVAPPPVATVSEWHRHYGERFSEEGATKRRAFWRVMQRPWAAR